MVNKICVYNTADKYSNMSLFELYWYRRGKILSYTNKHQVEHQTIKQRQYPK